MATRTVYLSWFTGATIYSKPLPRVLPWSGDETVWSDDGSGSYSASLDDTVPHDVFLQSGGGPASSDTVIASVPEGSDATAANQTLILAALTNGVRKYVGPVKPGGDLELVNRNDYTGSAAVTGLTVDDVGGLIHTRIQAADQTRFVVGTIDGTAEIVGTVDSAYASDVTTFTISIDQVDCDTAKLHTEMAYLIQWATAGGLWRTEVVGACCVVSNPNPLPS